MLRSQPSAVSSRPRFAGRGSRVAGRRPRVAKLRIWACGLRFREVDREVTKVKRIDKVRREYMLLSDELKRFKEAGRKEGRAEGRAEGIEEKMIRTMQKMILSGFTDEQILEVTENPGSHGVHS